MRYTTRAITPLQAWADKDPARRFEIVYHGRPRMTSVTWRGGWTVRVSTNRIKARSFNGRAVFYGTSSTLEKAARQALRMFKNRRTNKRRRAAALKLVPVKITSAMMDVGL